MKRFLLKILLYALPILILAVFLEIKTRNYNTIMKQKANYLQEHAEDIEVLILGNSHAGDGLDPNQFKMHTFNAAQGSQSLYYDFAITKKFLPSFTTLKFVLISMDYHSFYLPISYDREFMYAYYYGINYKNNILYAPKISLLFGGYTFKHGFKMIMQKPEISHKGWVGYNISKGYDLSEPKGKKRVASFDEIIQKKKKYRPEILQNLNDFIVLLKNKGIQPILFTLPCHKYFNQFLDKAVMTQNDKDIAEIVTKHQIPYINWLYRELPDSLYYNTDHLNKQGARFISQDLNRTLDSLNQSKR